MFSAFLLEHAPCGVCRPQGEKCYSEVFDTEGPDAPASATPSGLVGEGPFDYEEEDDEYVPVPEEEYRGLRYAGAWVQCNAAGAPVLPGQIIGAFWIDGVLAYDVLIGPGTGLQPDGMVLTTEEVEASLMSNA